MPLVPKLVHAAGAFLFHAFVSPEAEIGEGTEVGYSGSQVVIGPGVKIGRNGFVAQEVTIAANLGGSRAPVVGDFVFIGAGAQVLGDVKIGDYAVIGANAVVLEDVPPGAVVAGIPAVELKRDPDPEASYQAWLARAAGR